jgi:carboxymethylenebutenolidase
MPQQNVTIPTPDGACPTAVFTPDGTTGPWPGVILYMDAVGIRPAMWQVGQRLADAGYFVLVPDMYYREGPYAPKKPVDIFTDRQAVEAMMEKLGRLTPARKIADTGAFIAYLDGNEHVKGETYGATGYCMGGHSALVAAGAFPDKFAAAASYHGGGLATDQPDSPHIALKNTQARIYVAGAVEDAHFTDAQKALLETTLTEAGVSHLIETYEGAKHGFAVPDMPVYNEAAAERHWASMLALFGETLK